MASDKKPVSVLIIAAAIVAAGCGRDATQKATTPQQTNAEQPSAPAPPTTPPPAAANNSTPPAPASTSGLKGGLLVYTEPEGAFLNLGGQMMQFSPGEFDDVPAGKTTLTIQKGGYEVQNIDVEIPANTVTNLGVIKLMKTAGGK